MEESSRQEIETLQASVDAQKNELDLLKAEVTSRVRAKLIYQFLMKNTASWTPQKDIDMYLQYMGSMKDLMDEEDLAATAGSSSKMESCAVFIASDVPPDPETEKEAPAIAPSAAASSEKEVSKTSDA